MVFDTALSQYAFLLGRVVYGGLLAFMGFNHFLSTDQLAGYAEMHNVPKPRFMVLLSGAVLVAGGLSIVAGIYPMLGALLVLAFMVPVSIEMHAFWTVEDQQERKQEMTNFLKNMAIAATALVFLALAGTQWPYAVGMTL